MPEQIFFEDTPSWRGEEEEKKITPIVPEEEPINCQHCQDGGPCTYCKRGQEEQARIVEEQKKSGWNLWEQIRRAKNGGKG